MRILLGPKLRRVELRRVRWVLCIGICGGSMIGGIAASNAHARHPLNPPGWKGIERLGRALGVGWGDGYHACDCPVCASAPCLPPTDADRARWESAPSEVIADTSGASGVASFHAPAWRLDTSVISPASPRSVPPAALAGEASPASIAAPMPGREPLPLGSLPVDQPAPDEVSLLDCDPCAVPPPVDEALPSESVDPQQAPKLPIKAVPEPEELPAPPLRPLPLPPIGASTGHPVGHRPQLGESPPRTARAAAPARL